MRVQVHSIHFDADKKLLGFMHAVVGALPEEYKWITNIIGMKGSIQQGVDELNNLINSSQNTEYEYLKNESIFLLMFIQLNLQKNETEAINLSNQITKSTNPITCFALADIAIHAGKSDEAINILLQNPES